MRQPRLLALLVSALLLCPPAAEATYWDGTQLKQFIDGDDRSETRGATTEDF
jgi:hypothetical protein